MKKKSPKQLRTDIERIRSKVLLVVDVLSRNTEERMWGLGDECHRTALELKRLLDDNVVPSEYRVAVVGRFKAGKSSFVNEMLGRKLAGENTSPETAAITTFRYGQEIRATVHFIARSQWKSLQELHQADSRDPDAHRVANWHKFSGDGKSKAEADGEVFDLSAIERQYVADQPVKLEIKLNEADGNKGAAQFRKQLQLFTSSTKPHHCLVERLEITAPSPMLEEGVLLIDTPGLDDTERFRVELTEQAVQNVDAILFLTKSGAAYGQSEKDFLLSLLRKGTVKQLVFIITQVDQTYDQHVRQAKNDDEKPESVQNRIEQELRRIRKEIGETLDELSQNNESPAMQRYREQLGDIEIVFTSAAHHRDWKLGETIQHPLKADDPGGIETVKSTLVEKLSTESRLATTARNTESGARALLVRMLKLIDSRRQAVKNIKDREVAEQKLGMFRERFRAACEKFSVLTTKDVTVHRDALDAKKPLAEMNEQVVALKAEAVLALFERDDVGRHWRTRRSGYWGYMHQLQQKVANQIFPTVAELLQVYTQEFAAYLERFRAHLGDLSSEGNALAATLDLGDDVHLEIDDRLKTFLASTLATAQTMLEAEEARIVSLLDDFVSDEVQERISEARGTVASVLGTGTTWRQSTEVKQFYAQVKEILRTALVEHVRGRYSAYVDYLATEAQQLPARAISEAEAELSRVQDNIRASIEAAVHGQREMFDLASAEINNVIAETHQEIVVTFGGDEYRPLEQLDKAQVSVQQEQPADEEAAPFVDEEPSLEHLVQLIPQAKQLVRRIELIDGKGGWSYNQLFSPELLNRATSGLLVEPYLLKSHQVRNLIDFFTTIQGATKLKAFWVVTGEITEEKVAGTDARLNDLAKDLFHQAGITLHWRREAGIHDRYAVFDNGVLFKMGRGLDIFKVAGGLALNNQQLRRVRSCSIDIFRAA